MQHHLVGSGRTGDVVTLARQIFALYVTAVEMQELASAEHLLQALEELSTRAPDCECVLQQAYATILQLPRPRAARRK